MGNKIIAEGRIIYSQYHKQLRIGIGKTWEESPIILDVSASEDIFASYWEFKNDFDEHKIVSDQKFIEIQEQLDQLDLRDAATLEGHPASYFATADHTHNTDQINGLVELLNEMAPKNHVHNLNEIVDLLDQSTGRINLDIIPQALIDLLDKFDENGLLKERFLPAYIDCNNEF